MNPGDRATTDRDGEVRFIYGPRLLRDLTAPFRRTTPDRLRPGDLLVNHRELDALCVVTGVGRSDGFAVTVWAVPAGAPADADARSLGRFLLNEEIRVLLNPDDVEG